METDDEVKVHTDDGQEAQVEELSLLGLEEEDDQTLVELEKFLRTLGSYRVSQNTVPTLF